MMEYKGYIGKVEFDDEAGISTAKSSTRGTSSPSRDKALPS